MEFGCCLSAVSTWNHHHPKPKVGREADKYRQGKGEIRSALPASCQTGFEDVFFERTRAKGATDVRHCSGFERCARFVRRSRFYVHK